MSVMQIEITRNAKKQKNIAKIEGKEKSRETES